jgi:hypothetical protein
MRSLRFPLVACIAWFAAACGQPQSQQQAEGSSPPIETPEVSLPERAELPPVDAVLLAAPNEAFTAIEPSEVGVFGAPDVMQALDALLGPEMTEGGRLQVSVRESGDEAIADVVRTGMHDDAVAAGHVRIEFRREPDGWRPINAYRRTQCARGGEAGQWTTGLCP